MIELTFSEGLAVSAGIMQAFVSATFLRFRKARPDWGLGWLTATYAMASILNVGAPVLIKAQQVASLSTGSKLLALTLGVSTMGALVAGVHQYTGHARLGPWRWFGIMWLVYALSIVLRLAFPETPGGIGNWLTSGIFIYLISLFRSAARKEPTAGHNIAAVMLCGYPLMVLGAVLAGLPHYAVLYWATVPFTLAGLGIMSASMGRLHAELGDLNASLEKRVHERTLELQELMSSLEQFNGMVSHDLRGPLGGINGLSSVAMRALDEGDTSKAKRLFEVINTESGRLATLVSDLLTLAKVSHSELQIRKVPLNDLVQEAIQFLDLGSGEGRGAQVRQAIMPTVEADPGLLRQVLINLIGNARKFSRNAPTPDVHVYCEQSSDGIVVRVQDNGAGFDASKAHALFTPFKRLHTSSEFEGTGIGLTIVKRVIDRHGGRVWAESAPGQGAVFSFFLPAKAQIND